VNDGNLSFGANQDVADNEYLIKIYYVTCTGKLGGFFGLGTKGSGTYNKTNASCAAAARRGQVRHGQVGAVHCLELEGQFRAESLHGRLPYGSKAFFGLCR